MAAAFNLLFGLIGASLLIFLAFVLYRDPGRYSAAFVLFLGAAISLLVSNIDRIELFKAGLNGFEAKTREAQAVVDDARATVTSLRQLAVATAALQVDMLAAAGRFGGDSDARWKDDQKAHLLEQLKSLGLSDEQLATVEKADRTWVNMDYAFALLGPLNTAQDAAKRAAYGRFFNERDEVTPAGCRKLMDEFQIDDEKRRGILKDFEYYYETGKQRRPDVWHNRAAW